eukprot:233457-Amphidinium_carterae.1
MKPYAMWLLSLLSLLWGTVSQIGQPRLCASSLADAQCGDVLTGAVTRGRAAVVGEHVESCSLRPAQGRRQETSTNWERNDCKRLGR